MENTRLLPICGNGPAPLRFELCRYIRRQMTIYIRPGNWPFNKSETERIVLEGARAWSILTGIAFDLAPDLQVAHLVLEFARIDSPGRILAWSEYPCPDRPPIRQRYDTSETWANRAPSTRHIPLVTVVTHEIGHALGIDHASPGSPNIMAPAISLDVYTFGSWDRAQAALRYDLPINPEEPRPMNALVRCILAALPSLITCIIEAQSTAEKAGKPGPVDALTALAVRGVAGPSDPPTD